MKRQQHVRVSKHGGRALGWVGTGLGYVVSVAANMGDEYFKHIDHSSPKFYLALVFGVLWPSILLVTLEILARTQWPTHRIWLLRYVTLTPVAFVAAWVSYWHIQHLMVLLGEGAGFTSHVIPLAIDGLMVTASMALLAPAAVAKASRPAKAKPTEVVPTEAPAPKRPDVSALLPIGREILAAMHAAEANISKANFARHMREAGHAISKERASALFDSIQEA